MNTAVLYAFGHRYSVGSWTVGYTIYGLAMHALLIHSFTMSLDCLPCILWLCLPPFKILDCILPTAVVLGLPVVCSCVLSNFMLLNQSLPVELVFYDPWSPLVVASDFGSHITLLLAFVLSLPVADLNTLVVGLPHTALVVYLQTADSTLDLARQCSACVQFHLHICTLDHESLIIVHGTTYHPNTILLTMVFSNILQKSPDKHGIV